MATATKFVGVQRRTQASRMYGRVRRGGEMLETITLDGRRFNGFSHAPFAATQVDYVLAHFRLAGDAVKVFNDLDGVQRTKERRLEDLLTQILLSGRTYYILAGILTEEGKVWSRAEADANAARFAAITDLEEKKAMRDSIMRFVIGFVLVGSQEKVDA